MNEKFNELKTILINCDFEEKVAEKVALLLCGLIDDVSVIKADKDVAQKHTKFRSVRVRGIKIDSEKTTGSIKLSQCGLQGRVIDFDKKCRLELNGTSASIIKMNLDDKVMLVDIFKDKKLGKIKRVRGYSEDDFERFGLDDDEFLLKAQKNCFESSSIEPLYDETITLNDESVIILLLTFILFFLQASLILDLDPYFKFASNLSNLIKPPTFIIT